MHRPRVQALTAVLSLSAAFAGCGDDASSADETGTTTGPFPTSSDATSADDTATGTTAASTDPTGSGDTTANRAPEAVDDLYIVADNAVPLVVDAGTGVLANDSDADGDRLTVTFDPMSEVGGTPDGNPDGSFTYTPPTPFWGEDRFAYTVDDGQGGVTTAQVRVVVSPTAVPLAAVAAGVGGFVLDAEALFDQAAISVSAAGDVNDDGLADVVVGATGADPGGIDSAGRSYVVFGKVDTAAVSLLDIGLGSGGFALGGESASDRSGQSVSSAGDVDGDGLSDVIIGAASADPGGLGAAGRSYVVFGKADTGAVSLSDVTAEAGGFVLDGEEAFDASGASVSTAGDVNGDGLADTIVGAPQAGSPEPGLAYVVFGKADTAALPLSSVRLGIGGFILIGETASDSTGGSVSGAGDVDGDGLADVIVGARRGDPGGLDGAGRSYVVFGKADTAAVSLSDVAAGTGGGFALDGEAALDGAGWSVSGAGDVNGDGMADLIVGAPFADPGGAPVAGRSYVVFGKAGPAPVSLSDVAAGSGGFVLDGESADDESGRSVSGAGDVNGDGFADIIVGAPDATPGGELGTGRSYVVFGKADTAAVSLSEVAAGVGGFALDGEEGFGYAGTSVSAAGDVNGDGFADVIVGAYSASPPGLPDAGRGYVVFGGNFTGV